MFNSSLKHKIVLTSVAPIYTNPTFSSEMINQALFWEALTIIESKDNWFKIEQKDGYLGWVHSFYLMDSSIYANHSKFFNNYKNWYFVKDKFLEVSIDSTNKFFISFGSIIPCRVNNGKFIIIFPSGKEYVVPKESLITNRESLTIENVIDISFSLLNIPYLWGGRSSYGFDCSGLVQSLLSILKIDFPRDTKDQINFRKMNEVKFDYCKGDIVFFSKNNLINHVGIFINENEYLHSSGYVKINSINHDDCNYDDDLFNLLDSVYRVL